MGTKGFELALPKIPNVFIFTIFGPSGNVHDTPNPLFVVLVALQSYFLQM